MKEWGNGHRLVNESIMICGKSIAYLYALPTQLFGGNIFQRKFAHWQCQKNAPRDNKSSIVFPQRDQRMCPCSGNRGRWAEDGGLPSADGNFGFCSPHLLA